MVGLFLSNNTKNRFDMILDKLYDHSIFLFQRLYYNGRNVQFINFF